LFLLQNGRDSLGDSIYRTITDDQFDPNELLNSVDLSTEYKIVDLKDKIEASVVIWQRKLSNKLYWGPGVSLEKREQFEERAETVLLILKHKFPGTAQSSLDISKIQYNKVGKQFQLLFRICYSTSLHCNVLHFFQDVGSAILESYSRALESLAFAVLSRIEDVLHADNVARDARRSRSKRRSSLADIPESLVIDDTEPNSARANDSLHWEDLQDRSLDTSGAKLKKVPRISTRICMHTEKIENVCGGGSRSFSQR
jgi:hypothetical protein